MKKTWLLIAATGFFVIFALLCGAYAYRWHSVWEQAPKRDGSSDLGITYIAINPSVVAYYGLGVDSGALVTAVAPDSPAARAGIRPGDVILTYNGVNIRESSTLLMMLRSCPAGSEVNMELYRANAINLLRFSHNR